MPALATRLVRSGSVISGCQHYMIGDTELVSRNLVLKGDAVG